MNKINLKMILQQKLWKSEDNVTTLLRCWNGKAKTENAAEQEYYTHGKNKAK